MKAVLAALVLGACTTTIGADDAFWGTTPTHFEALSVNGEALNPEDWQEGWEIAQRYEGEGGLPFGAFLDQPTEVVAVIRRPAPGRFVLRASEHQETVRTFVGQPGEAPWAVQMTHTSDDAEAPFVAYCGGNTFSLPMNGAFALTKLRPFGHALVFEYPGYGYRGDEETTAKTMAAFAARAAATLDRDLSGYPGPVILWGHSLGGVVCADIASRSGIVDAVILEASVRNADATIRAWTPWWAKPFARVRIEDGLADYDAVAALRGFDGPVLVLGAGRDEVLPPKLARTLAADLDAYGVRVTYAEFPEARHVDIVSAPGFRETVGAFLDGVGRGSDELADP